jgi:hypothetical protein
MSAGVGELLPGYGYTCRCGHDFERHPIKEVYGSTLAWDCTDCRCPIYEDPASEVYCFCQRSRQPDGSRNICY